MKIEQLRYFVALAKLEHMTNTAEEVHISEPALSKSIASLEKELSVDLFDRHGRNIFINRYGRLFLPYAQTALEAIDDGVMQLKSLRKEHGGQIIIRTPPTLMFPGLLSAITHEEPNVVIMTANMKDYDLEIELLNGATDLCLTSKELANQSLDDRVVGTDEVVLVISPRHPLYRNIDQLDFELLQQQAFVTGREGSMSRMTFDQVFGGCKENPEIAYTVGAGVVEALEFISMGTCVALTTRAPLRGVPAHYEGSYEVVQLGFLAEEQRIKKFHLYWNKRTASTPTKRVLKVIEQYFAEHNPISQQ